MFTTLHKSLAFMKAWSMGNASTQNSIRAMVDEVTDTWRGLAKN